MYQSHFNFKNPPFRKITRLSGDFLVPYHQDVFNLLKEKTQRAGITGLFSNDAPLLGQFNSALKSANAGVLAINAFPKLSASSLLYKLNPGTKESKNRLQAVDAVLRQWQEGKAKAKVLVIAHTEAMKDNCREVLAMLLTRAQELDFRLSVVLMGAADQEAVLKQQPELREYTHTHHALRPLTCREFLSYVQAQCEEHGCDASPLTPARVRKMHALTKGSISKLNELAHLSLLAAWTERARQVSPRHLRLAAGEILPAKKHGKRLATVGLFASVLFAACGWYLTSSISARLPVQLPVPVSWQHTTPKVQAPVVPVMHYVYVSKPFPHPQPEPVPVHTDVPAMQDLPINSDDADWQQAPDGAVPHDTSRDTLPGTEAHDAAPASAGSDDSSLTALFKQALKEQEQDYSQGKIPAPPVDETQENPQSSMLHENKARSPLSIKGDRLE